MLSSHGILLQALALLQRRRNSCSISNCNDSPILLVRMGILVHRKAHPRWEDGHLYYGQITLCLYCDSCSSFSAICSCSVLNYYSLIFCYCKARNTNSADVFNRSVLPTSLLLLERNLLLIMSGITLQRCDLNFCISRSNICSIRSLSCLLQL